ncbi:hypothetical protein G9P44_001243 [Scheffersomyces stipitis]|nr:hypothetical protein G9P44_001243 [Scheffersomyces stipitis]
MFPHNPKKNSPLPYTPSQYDDDVDSLDPSFGFGDTSNMFNDNHNNQHYNLNLGNSSNKNSNKNNNNVRNIQKINSNYSANEATYPHSIFTENNTHEPPVNSFPSGTQYRPTPKLEKELPNPRNNEYELSNMDESNNIRRYSYTPYSAETSNYNNYDEIRAYSPNPFADRNLAPLPSIPHSDPFEETPLETSSNDLLKDESDSHDRQQFNERERIKLLRRKPRFHYTRLPYFTILVTLIQVIVFIVELARMAQLTGSAFQTKPYFNPMLGPSTYLLIYMGARYVPCMSQIVGITDDTSIMFPCANSTTVDTNVCNLSELCGLGGVPIVDNKFIPDQWYRVITPIFLHAGFLHIIFNLLLQITMGSSIERHIGVLKYAIIYLSSGIAGFLLGANFTPQGIASTGASGALFGIVATNILLFIYCGRKNTNLYGTRHYVLFICIMVGEIIISLVLGLLPGLDNFSHIGGFAMGVLTAVVFLPDPFFVYIDGIITYKGNATTWEQFVNAWNPFYAWEDKIPLRFYIWCGFRVVCLVLAIVYLAMLIKNFFTNTESPESRCSWCKYINCIPVNGWCDIGEVTITTSTVAQPTATPPPTMQAITTVITTTQAPSLPTSIENNNKKRTVKRFSSQISKRNHLWTEIFEENVQANHPLQIDSNPAYLNEQNIGIGLYVILGLLTFMFLKKKKMV